MKIAVIGCGYWGKNLIRNFSELGALSYVHDKNEKLSKSIAKKYSVPQLSFQDLCRSDVDGIVIATSAETHYTIAVEALKHGKNIFIEKPISTKLEHAERIINLAKKNRCHLMIGHLMHYHPSFIKLKEIVRNKKYGKIVNISSIRQSLGKFRTNENIIWSFAPHDLSMIFSLVSSGVKELHCSKDYIINRKIADKARLFLKFKNGINADINVSWISPSKEQKLVVTFEKGIITFDDTEDWDRKLAITNFSIDNVFKKNKNSKPKKKYSPTKLSEPLKLECKYFIDLMKNLVPPKTDGLEALKVLNLISETDKF